MNKTPQWGEGGLLPAQGLVVLRIIGYNIVCVVNCFHSFMENLWLKDVLGMYTVLRQVLHGSIIRVLQTQFSSLSCVPLIHF